MTAPHGSESSKPAQSSPASGAGQQRSAQPAAPQRFVAGAVDLGHVKAQADQRDRHAEQAAAAGVSVDYVARTATIEADTFEPDLVMRSTQVPVILLVGLERSEASEALRALLSRLVEIPDVPQEQLAWVFRYINADQYPEMAQALGVQGLPTVIALAGGRPAASFQGAQPEEQVEQWIAQLTQAFAGRLQGLPSDGTAEEEDVDPRMAQAAEALSAGDHDAAISIYDAILADTPNDSEAKSARAQTVVLKRVGDRTDLSEQIAAAKADHTDVAAAEVVADALLLQGDKVAAFDALIATISATVGDERTRTKDRLLELFAMYDPADPEVIAARTKMASALF